MKVSKRNGFSDRNGIKKENDIIQLKEIDKRTRIQLQNMISQLYANVYKNDLYYRNHPIQDFLKFVMGTIYSSPVDEREIYDDDKVFMIINNTIQNDDYDDVLTLIEAITQYWDEYLKETEGYNYYNEYDHRYRETSIFDMVNIIFKREYVGYRFIDGILTSISDENEITAIEDALNCKYSSVYDHLSKANGFLANREKPDYENSIKESISAVEAICEEITGIRGKEATLGKMLKKIEENGIEIHSGLKSAFNILYGYTSEANGIRHAGDIGGPSSTFYVSKFILISCISFINYLVSVQED